ncbi:VOC family protein [Kitasatospora sp. NPDC127059]|uniref:VOC family protein n=1 Tax=unclassified Kitasatospora TaxID=2633591 RepID=UPI003665609B
MDFVSIRVITGDVARLVGFYERATGARAVWATEEFAELRTAGATLAIAGAATVALFAPGSARAADNRSVITEFLAADVDRLAEDLAGVAAEVVAGPATMPWGNRSLLVRDPDGNLVNFFTPVTPEAVAKYAR